MGHYASEMGYGSDEDWQRQIRKIREAGFTPGVYEARPWVCPRCYALVQTEQTLLHLATHTPLPAGDLPYDDQLKRAIRTLLPGLRLANYKERWSASSPAAAALKILCEHASEPMPVAGELMDPEVQTVHPRRPEGEPDVRVRVAAWLADCAYAPDDIVLGRTGLTEDQLPDLHELLDIIDPEWRSIFPSDTDGDPE